MIYLDNAATTYPKPAAVIRAVTAAMLRCGNPGRGSHRAAMRAAEEVYLCRKAAAGLFGASPERVIFTMNTTWALNMAIKGAAKRFGGAILISDLEHNAVYRPAAASGEVRIFDSAVGLRGADRTAAILASAKSRCDGVGVMVCTAASNIIGAAMPIRELGEFCRERGIFFIVDGAQAGGILPLDVEHDSIGALCLPGHKGLYGPMGAGMLILGDDVELPTLVEGGSGVNSAEVVMPELPPERYEAGTLPVAAIAGLRSGIRFVTGRTDAFRRQEEALAVRLKRKLSGETHVKVHAPECGGGIVLFETDAIPSEDMARMLDRYGIAVRAGLHCAPLAHRRIGSTGAVRASFGAFSTEKDADALADAVHEIIRTTG